MQCRGERNLPRLRRTSAKLLCQQPGKLADALPLLVGRTIERTVVVEHADGRFSVYLLFDDRSVYEFYGVRE